MSKRVNGGGMVEHEFDDRAVKRRKFPYGNTDITTAETTESTTQSGLELLEIVKKTTDKNGRLIATDFLTLPNRRFLPDYYHVTKLPIALDTIEGRLKRREFPNLTSLESYLKRMVLNAKEYNEKGSIIHEDAERLRRTINSYMVKHNPAYKNTPGYVVLPTPIPSGGDTRIDGDLPQIEEQVTVTPRHLSKNHQAFRSSATPALSDLQYSGLSFEGLSFQQAQEKIVEDMISEKEYEEDDFGAFEPFIKLPSRKEYKDYYNIITHPLALKDLQKAVKGVRLKTPGISEFKTWSAFEDEAAYIWKNAFLYNEDNSDIFKLAMDLQAFFNKLLQKAKSVVPEPVSTKIKLRLPEPTKITLKIGMKPSPVSSPACQATPQTTGGQANTNGTVCQNVPSTLLIPLPTSQPEQARSISRPAPSPTSSHSAPVKNEENIRNTPVAPSYNRSSSVTTNDVMPPPPTAPLPTTYPQSGYAQSYFHQTQPTIAFDSKFRKFGNDAMITNLSIATHPGLNISSHFRMDLPPSPILAQQSVTINLPATHYYLQIKPSIASSMMQRQHKLFLTAGTTRLHAMPTIPGHPVEPRNPLFEARLHPGVNRIEIELVAALPKDYRAGNEIEMEKISIFVNLMKA